MIHEGTRAWAVFIEVRDALRTILAPALPLRHLLSRGSEIGRSLRQSGRTRPMQRSKLAKILGVLLG